MTSTSTIRVCVLACVLLLTAGAVGAQLTSGNLYGKAVDNQGSPIPGVTVTLTGQGAPQVQVTDAQGQFRFLGLSPGFHHLRAELDGFSSVEHPSIEINIGRSTTLELEMSPALEETITVTSESPLLDSRKITTGTTVTQVELEKIPTARDPWVILQSVPGVLVDRVNVGGNQSGQQSNFIGNGSGRASATWSVDGVTITDPAARGASPSYYDFDAFTEMQMATGGTDIDAVTSGVQLNLVTKRGTNEWRGSARFFNTGEGQASSSISDSEAGVAGAWNRTDDRDGDGVPDGSQLGTPSSFDAVRDGNRTDNVDEYGGDVGGPILKNKLWIWASYSFQDIEAIAFGGSPDATELENYAGKLNAQLSSSNSLVLFYHFGDKLKFGRGAAPTRPPETTWNQTGPTDIEKIEDTHIFSSNLYLTAMASYVGGGFQLIPQAGLEAGDLTRDEGLVWHNSFQGYFTVRPQDQARIDGSYFFNTGDSTHELKFGVGYRKSEVYSASPYPGRGLVGLRQIELGPGVYRGEARHTPIVQDEFTQKSLSLQDTITVGNLTINAGVRYDLQEPTAGGVTIPAHPFFPNEMPEIVKPAPDAGFDWETISPRVGVTYALGEEKKTLLRASYSRFVDQLGTGFFNDLGSSTFRRGYFYWNDANDNVVIEDNEIGELYRIAGSPGTPSANQVAPGYDPFTTDELVLGVEHALRPELVVGFTATIRQNKDYSIDVPLVVDASGSLREATRADYANLGDVSGVLPDGSSYQFPIFGLVNRDPARGFVRQNSGQSEDYTGLSFTINKRLADRWMLRGHFSLQDWTNEGIDAQSQPDPSRFVNSVNGSQVLTQSAGSGSFAETWINSSWNFNISGLYQVAPDRPWGFNIGADINGREGFARPYRVSIPSSVSGDGITRSILVAPSNDSFRNDDIILFNLRLEKEFTINNVGLTVGLDAFNLFNDNSTLQREGFLSSSRSTSSQGDWIREAVSPRVFRFGLRLNFN